MDHDGGLTKRAFLQTMRAGMPSLKLLGAAPEPPLSAGGPDSGKFTPVDCSQHFNAGGRDFDPRKPLRMPSGRRDLRGIPFALGPSGAGAKSWIALRLGTPAVEIPLGRKASFLCLAQFCAPDPDETPAPGSHSVERVGQVLAELVLVYEAGGRHVHPIRRRFEVNSPSITWGHLCFAAVTHRKPLPRKLTEPLPSGRGWGDLQMGLWDGDYAYPGEEGIGLLWISAIPNPSPDRALKSVRLEPKARIR